MSAPGDCLFASQPGFVNWWIRFAQRVKYHGSPAARWNHVALITSYKGDLIQAVSRGMVRGHLSDYAGQDIEIRRPPYTPSTIVSGGDIATSAMEELLADHDEYGWVEIACVALALLTGTKVRFGVKDTLICSGAVSYALTRANIDVGDDSDWNTPSDLYSYALSAGWAVV